MRDKLFKVLERHPEAARAYLAAEDEFNKQVVAYGGFCAADGMDSERAMMAQMSVIEEAERMLETALNVIL